MADEKPRGEVAPGDLRASHEDRDEVVEVLRVAAGDGRLTADELDERLELAMNARTYRELATLTADLPAVGTKPGAPAAQAKDIVRIDCRSGHAVRNGRWIVPQRMDLHVTSGHIVLDLTEAVITQRVLKIEAEVRSGHLVIVTKPGIVVDTDDVTVRSGHVKVRAPWSVDVPELLRVEVTGLVGSGHIIARPKHRSFWHWLLRKPYPYALTAS